MSYFTGTPEVLETVVEVTETLNQTKTLVGPSNQTISHTQPFFTITPTAGVELTVPVGSTYVIYQSLYGGLDLGPSRTTTLTNPTSGMFGSQPEASSCTPNVNYLPELAPTATEDWSYYIQTIAEATDLAIPEKPYPLPPGLVEFLKNGPGAQTVFNGSDIATCTLATTSEPSESQRPVEPPSTTAESSTTLGEAPHNPSRTKPTSAPALSTGPPEELTTAKPPAFGTATTSTYLSTTYQTTSTHITVRGCLRCDTVTVESPPTDRPLDDPKKPTEGPHDAPNNPTQTRRPNPLAPPNPPPGPSDTQNAQLPNDKPRVTIGTGVYEVNPAQPTQAKPSQPNQNQPTNQYKPTGVVIGTNTFTYGQTTTWNGVQVVVPSSGGGSTIMVGGSSVALNPAATAPPILTVGDKTVTANSQGQFVIGTQTLAPGKPAVTIDGTTLQLGPSGSIAIVNGQTQTLGHVPLPTNAPAITVDGQIFTASVIGGTTVFAMGSQTLTPGGVLTKDGTTFSMPASGDGSTVVVNGVTSTLAAPGLPVLTLGSESSQSAITASVQGGTTAFVLGPSQTLTPGGVLTVSGTTYSLPASASGSVVVINGVTSTLGQGPVTAAAALTIDGKTYSATVRDGTTEFDLGEGTTLKPGQSVVMSGTTYSLDPKGTALVIDGKTSTIPKTPASNTASTTQSPSSSSTSDSSSTTSRDPGEFIASGLGISESRGGAGSARAGGFDKIVEGAVMGLAGWLLMLA